ncbi:hypothetical protein D3C84_1021410 [compost metagenome]
MMKPLPTRVKPVMSGVNFPATHKPRNIVHLADSVVTVVVIAVNGAMTKFAP